VFVEEIVLKDCTDNITSCDEIASFPLLERSELPLFNLIKARDIDSSGDEYTA